jgi:hypothetical protein
VKRLAAPAVLLAALVVLAGCSDPEPADRIASLFDGLTEASAGGIDSLYEYVAEHDHPGMPCTPELLRDHYGFPDDLQIAFEVDRESIVPDPEWTMQSGPGAGGVPSGDVYFFDVVQTVDGEATVTDSHASIVDGEAYFFISCFDQ